MPFTSRPAGENSAARLRTYPAQSAHEGARKNPDANRPPGAGGSAPAFRGLVVVFTVAADVDPRLELASALVRALGQDVSATRTEVRPSLPTLVNLNFMDEGRVSRFFEFLVT